MRSRRISLEEYDALCRRSDLSPNYLPEFVEYYFARLRRPPTIIGKFDAAGRLVAAFPRLWMQVFPNSLHKVALPGLCRRLGEFGQPENLFPIDQDATAIPLNALAPTASPLLSGKVRGFPSRSLRSVAIARSRRHRKLTLRQRAFLESGGTVHFTESLPPKEFADVYVKLHALRWGYPEGDLAPVREQIVALYPHVFGLVLEFQGTPVAVQLCYRAVGRTLYYVDFVNSGVRRQKDNTISFGSIMMLTSLRRAEEEAAARGKSLRFSFGYYYGDNTYKAVWAEAEATFVAF